MENWFSEHKNFWTPHNKKSLYLSVLLIILSLVIQIGAGRYSARRSLNANWVGDIFLDNLPVVNLDFLIVQGAIILWVACIFLLVLRPRYLLFGLKAVAIFIIIRAFFIDLTHIGAYPLQAVFDPGNLGYRFYELLTFQGNFFFSGHTGFPFLMALIFWPEKFWRKIFLILSFAFGVAVLFAHVHYSIDVFSAPFITYGIFKVAEKMFARDYSLMPKPAEPLTTGEAI